MYEAVILMKDGTSRSIKAEGFLARRSLVLGVTDWLENNEEAVNVHTYYLLLDNKVTSWSIY